MSSPFPRDFVKILGTKFSSRPSKETETIRGGTFHETKSFPFTRPVAALRPARGLLGEGGLPACVGRRQSGAFAQNRRRSRALPRGRGQRGQHAAARGCGQRAGRHLHARRERASPVPRADGARRAARRRSACGGCAGRGRLRRRYFGELSRIVRRGGAHHRPAGRI